MSNPWTHTYLWRKLRERKILAKHRRVAAICEELLAGYRAHPEDFPVKAKQQFDTDKIIWQYWAQGYDQVPAIVKACLDSVDKYAGEYRIIRLTDENLPDYLDLPEFVQRKRTTYSRAHFADLLRLLLLKTYGGVWMDATILMSGPIPREWGDADFFVFRRDPAEPDYKYWRNTYAYYFGWAKGFRVNILNSFIIAKKGNGTITDLCNLLLLWWRDHDNVPDYFFFQILYDVYDCPDEFELVNDTLPHYLQQSINDPKFMIMQREDILKRFPIHKLTYK